MHNKIINFDKKKYNFEEYLFIKYKEQYPELESFSKIHKLLNSDKIDFEKKQYYEDKIKIFGSDDRGGFLTNTFYHLFDSDYTFLHLYLDFVKNIVKPLFPEEDYILIQKTPNIRFHLHGFSNIGKRETDNYKEFIGVHTDSEFGHSTHELNFILPITDMFDTNSIYFEKNPYSTQHVKNFDSIKISNNQLFIGWFSRCRHYNKINTTDNTRVSFDFRVLPFSKYKDNNLLSATSKTKFTIGNYFMLI